MEYYFGSRSQYKGSLSRLANLQICSSGSQSGTSSVQGKSVSASQSQSKSASRRGSNGSISSKLSEVEGEPIQLLEDTSAEDADDMAMMNSHELQEQQEKAKKEILDLTSKLRAFQQSHERELLDLKQKHSKQMKEKEEESSKFMMVLYALV